MKRTNSSLPRRSKSKLKKPISADLKNNAGVVNVKWDRDVPAGKQLPQHVKDSLAALSMEHSSTRQQLAALRASRGQREVGTLVIPAHLKAPIPMSDAGVERRIATEE